MCFSGWLANSNLWGEPMESATGTTIDVLVVGGGGSGLAAAAAAAELGRSVVLLEKNKKLGGSTAWSVGSVTASCTSHQIKKGIKDHPGDHWEDYKLVSGAKAASDNFELARVLTTHIPETFRWLNSIGLDFIGPMPEAPHRVPRMHNILPNSRAFPFHLGRVCRKLGVDMRLNCRVQRLVFANGRISGAVVIDAAGREEEIACRGGVVLAAGDYSASPEFKAQLVSADAAIVDPVNPTATGDGFRVALAHGAMMVNGNQILGPTLRFIPPKRSLVHSIPPLRIITRFMKWSLEHLPAWLLRPFIMSFLVTALGPDKGLYRVGAVLINKNGARFTDEVAAPDQKIAHQPDRIAYILLDSKTAGKLSAYPHFVSTAPGLAYAYLSDYRRSRPDLYHSAATLRELAGKLGMDASVLDAAIAAYNADQSDNGVPGRQDRPPLEGGPFVALGPVRAYVVATNGSLKVSPRQQVLDGAGAPIPGLFAAGSNGQGGMLLNGHGHRLGWAFTSGRLAGKEAALYRPDAAPISAG